MTRSYDEIMAPHRARLTPQERAAQEVFEEAYDLAVALIELRESRGLTQVELADRCGVDQADISRIERGSTSPTVRTLRKITDALGADVRVVARAS